VANHKSKFTFLDNDGEKSTVEVYNGAITAISLAGFFAAFGNLRNAMAAITKGTIYKESWVGDETVLDNSYPDEASAQRELKWLVTYEGNTTHKLFQIAIPTADPDGLDGADVPRKPAGSELANLNNEDIAAFVTAFEAIARTPDSDTETVTVVRIRLVGRNI